MPGSWDSTFFFAWVKWRFEPIQDSLLIKRNQEAQQQVLADILQWSNFICHFQSSLSFKLGGSKHSSRPEWITKTYNSLNKKMKEPASSIHHQRWDRLDSNILICLQCVLQKMPCAACWRRWPARRTPPCSTWKGSRPWPNSLQRSSTSRSASMS